MTQTSGQNILDYVEVMDLTLSRRMSGAQPVVQVKYSVGSSKTGTRVGPGDRNANWSQETVRLSSLLLEQVEKDILKDLFVGGDAIEPTTDNFPGDDGPPTDGGL